MITAKIPQTTIASAGSRTACSATVDSRLSEPAENQVLTGPSNPYDGFAPGAVAVYVRAEPGAYLANHLAREGFSQAELWGVDGAVERVLDANPEFEPNPQFIRDPAGQPVVIPVKEIGGRQVALTEGGNLML